MNRIARKTAICAAAFILAGAALVYAVSRPAGPAKAFDGRTVMRMDGKNGFVSTIYAARGLFAGLYEKEGVGDPFGGGYKVYAGDFSAVVVKDGDGYRIRSLALEAAFVRGDTLYTQRFDIREGAVSSYVVGQKGGALPAGTPVLMDLAAKLDAMDMNACAESLPACDAYSIELMDGGGARAGTWIHAGTTVDSGSDGNVNYVYGSDGGGVVSVGSSLYLGVVRSANDGIIVYEDDGRLANIAEVMEHFNRTGGGNGWAEGPVYYTYEDAEAKAVVSVVALVRNEEGGYTGEEDLEIELE